MRAQLMDSGPFCHALDQVIKLLLQSCQLKHGWIYEPWQFDWCYM